MLSAENSHPFPSPENILNGNLGAVLVEDDDTTRIHLADLLARKGIPCAPCPSIEVAKRRIRPDTGVVITDQYFANGERGTDLIEWTRTFDPSLPIILFTE